MQIMYIRKLDTNSKLTNTLGVYGSNQADLLSVYVHTYSVHMQIMYIRKLDTKYSKLGVHTVYYHMQYQNGIHCTMYVCTILHWNAYLTSVHGGRKCPCL